jgi:hypothetical protein
MRSVHAWTRRRSWPNSGNDDLGGVRSRRSAAHHRLDHGRRRCHWTSTTAEVFEAGRYKGFRWSDSTDTLHLSLHAPIESRCLEAGTRIELHYDQCHPARWSLGPPRRDNPVLIIGWILTAVGILCTVTGFFLLML